jgi:CO dehydrogenase maturation factor
VAKVIAIAGKGGVGKTTVAALFISFLSKKGVVLAIDADPSSNLNQALGLPLGETIGNIREKLEEELRKGTFSAGITKKDFLDMKVREALAESEKIDLLVMGRPEGPGCYCAVNNILRSIMDSLKNSYDYVVVDCEAGMEHISRQTTQNVDYLIIVSDPTARSLNAAAGINALISDLRSNKGKTALLLNRVLNDLPSRVQEFTTALQISPTIIVPEDRDIYDLEILGKPVTDLPEASPLKKGVRELVTALGL